MNNKPYLIHSLRCLGICLLVFFSINLSFATTPPNSNALNPCYNDKEAPHIKCPDDVTVWMDCDEHCTTVDCWYAKAWDNCDDNPHIYFDVDRDYCFLEGTTEIWAWAVDKAGNKSEKCGFLVTVKQKKDKEPPHIKCPDDVTIWMDCDEKCTKANCWDAKAWDNCDKHPEIYFDVERDYCFREGTTEIWAWAVDKAGNQSEKCGFLVTVKVKKDKEPPHIKCPDDIYAWVDCDEKCTEVDCFSAKAWDNCDRYPDIYYDVDRDHCFKKGVTEVWAWAVDKAGNKSEKCGFKVIVKERPDKKAPEIKCPEDVVVEIDCASRETCAKAKFGEPKAWDNCDPHPKVWCDYKSGDCFPIGTTEVWCFAKDDSGNESKCSFTVTVKKVDKTPPVITCPWPTGIDLYINCGLTCSRIMWWMDAMAKDDCDPNPKIWCEVKGKAIDKWYCFPLGENIVTCYAQDNAGNKSSCSYTVTVKIQDDYVPPVITCPKDIMAMADRYKMCKEVSFAATATDNCTVPTITYTVNSGNGEATITSGYCFPMGKSRVTATAKDKAGNAATCIFYVTVMGSGDLVRTVNNGTESNGITHNKAGETTISVSENTVTNNTLNVAANQRLTRKEFAIYPNPTHNFVNVDLQQYQGKDVTVNVVNSVGQQMYSTTLKEVANQPYQIDMQEYPSGMYLIKVSAEGLEPMAKKVLRH